MNRDRRNVPGSHAFNARNPFIVIGTRQGLNFAKTKPGVLVAPIDLDPNSLAWPVQDIEPDPKFGRIALVIAVGAPREVGSKLAGALIRDGADRVICLYEDGSTHHERNPV